MKPKSLRCLDYLDWLKNQEEFLLWQLDVLKRTDRRCPADDADVKDEEAELQLVREIKELVTNYTRWQERDDDGPA